MSRALKKSLTFVICVSLCGISVSRLSAVEYRYTTIADSTDPRISSFAFNGVPAINDRGTVVFGATLTNGHEAIFAGNGGPLTTVADTNSQFRDLSFEEISINTDGTVAFLGSLDVAGGVFAVNESVVTAIADSTGDFGLFRGVSISDAGTVAFFAEGTGFSGIYAGNGGPLTTIVERRSSSSDDVPIPDRWEPSINNRGEVAFFGYLPSTGSAGIFVGNGDSLNQIVAASDSYRNFRPERRCPITDAGMVAFAADGYDTTGIPIRGVYRYSEGTVEQIITTEFPAQHDLSDVMINEDGTVAFGGLSDPWETLRGIFTGPDPEADRVIGYGDLLDGSPVTFVRFWGQGLNDRGQVAFFAETEDAVGIYLATPIPEPATLLLVGVAVGMIAIVRRSCRERCLITGSLIVAAALFYASSLDRAAGDTFGSGDNTFDIEFVTIGRPHNDADTTGNPNPGGNVDYGYRIGKFEISEQMIDKANALGNLGITKSTRGPDKPATFVSWFEVARFVNWLNTSTGSPPAYHFDTSGNFQLWEPTDAGYDLHNPYRNRLARYFLPSTHEWYKAAYYDPIEEAYYDYPTGSNTAPTAVASGTAADTAVYGGQSGPADVTLAGVLSPYGTMGQGGNVSEWNESPLGLANVSALSGRVIRGGGWLSVPLDLSSSGWGVTGPSNEIYFVGFRVASKIIPEPSTALLLCIGSLAVATLGRRHSNAYEHATQRTLFQDRVGGVPCNVSSAWFRAY